MIPAIIGFIAGEKIFDISAITPICWPEAEKDANFLDNTCNIFNEVITNIKDKAGEKIPKIAPNLSVAFSFCLVWNI